MTTLSNILYRCRISEVIGSTHIGVTDVAFDSRLVQPGTAFVAVKGTITDGHRYIESAVQKGAVAIICETIPEQRNTQVTYVQVADSGEALAFMASNFYDNPSEKLKLVGITGTNGKTTTASLLHQLFTNLGYTCGLLSTVNIKIGKKEKAATHTTPDPLALNSNLAEMADAGCEYCFMEVSSHAVIQHRTTGLHFTGGVFTNITHDHLDYHKTFDEYIKAKKGFFDKLPPSAFALVNADDKNGLVMVQNTKAAVHTYALRRMADFHGKVLENQFDGILLNINGVELWSKLTGSFNAYNLTAIYGTSMLLEASQIDVLTQISALEPVAGRFQKVMNAQGIVGIVDYAHTPDALANVLNTINDIRNGAGKLITVVGAGGDRDRTKRPVMAGIASRLSSQLILTSDNPRTEDPMAILAEMEAGVPVERKKHLLVIEDRHMAIKTACLLAAPGDVILVAGKGHEQYQEVGKERKFFDDKTELEKHLNIN